jgi:hypothetical protein
MLRSLVSLAEAHNLTPQEAIGLKPTVERAAQKVGMSPQELLFQCHTQPELGEYICEVARKVSKDSNCAKN